MTTSHKIEFTVAHVGQEYQARIAGIDAVFSGKSEEEAAARLLSWLAEQFAAKALKRRKADVVARQVIEQKNEREQEVIMYQIPSGMNLRNKE